MADDWTDGRFDHGDDDFVMPKGHADGKTTEQVNQESGYAPMPRGPQTLFISRIEIVTRDENNQPIEKTHEAWVNGQKVAIDNYEIQATFALASDPGCTVRQFLHCPPSDPEQAKAFAMATTKESGKQKGFWYNRLRNLVGALGFDTDNGSIPDAAMVFKNLRLWPDGAPRLVIAEVVDQVDQETKQPKVGANGHAYPDIALFSFKRSEDTLKRLGLPIPAANGATTATQAPANGGGKTPATQAPATAKAPANGGTKAPAAGKTAPAAPTAPAQPAKRPAFNF